MPLNTSDVALNLDTVVDFFVAGTPKPQGSKRGFVHPSTKRVILTEAAGGALKDWRHDVKLTAMSRMSSKTMITPPTAVRMMVEFVLPRPVSLPKTKPTPLAVKKPDTDKLLRAIGDALTGVVYADDSQVVSLYADKRIAELGEQPGARIMVGTMALDL